MGVYLVTCSGCLWIMGSQHVDYEDAGNWELVKHARSFISMARFCGRILFPDGKGLGHDPQIACLSSFASR
jgi:hypothetical protein